MTKKNIGNKDSIEEKLAYIGLDFNDIPKQLKSYKPLKYKIPRFADDKKYRQYRYVDVKNIQILLSPTNRLDTIEEKYMTARPLAEYLDNTSEENLIKYTTFLSMLKQVNIEEIEKIQEEQELLSKEIPFKVKYENNYLWQIYYSEVTDQYFMIVSTEDTNFSTFFYLLKRQIERKRMDKIFVPINQLEYSNKYLKKSEYEDIENYLWLFTKDWPLIYEVYDKKEELSIHIVGETEIYQKIKSPYKVKLKSKAEVKQFYKLIKALFILQTEVSEYFKFKTKINRTGSIDFYYGKHKIKYKELPQWIIQEYELGKERKQAIEELIKENTEKLEKYKVDILNKEREYAIKEKQITTFLECKKTFLGKFKYYFKYNKKKNKNKKNNEDFEEKTEDLKSLNLDNENIKNENVNNNSVTIKKDSYNIEEIVELYKKIEGKLYILKNILMDLNSMKLKNKNMQKKIENATAYIEEIESHKKSIFEFWRYSNKDEMSTLPEGEMEEVNIRKKITKIFDYEEDLEKFGTTMDRIQSKELTKEEKDSVYLTSTNVIDILNKIKINEYTPKDIADTLKQLKADAVDEKILLKNEEFDIFGGLSQESTKVSMINNKRHREVPKDKFNILEISKATRQLGFKLSLENVIVNIKNALEKIVIQEDVPVYKAILDDKLDDRKINIFDINPENEMKEALKKESDRIYFYRVALPKGKNAISFTNSIFYDNQNKTLPEGQDLSSKILIDTNKLKLRLRHKEIFKIVDLDNENNVIPELKVKIVEAYEFEVG